MLFQSWYFVPIINQKKSDQVLLDFSFENEFFETLKSNKMQQKKLSQITKHVPRKF
jgi:hypothetical protein